MKRKDVYDTKAGRVAKEGDRFRVYIWKDSKGKPKRIRFDILEEAKAYLDQITAKLASGGEWFASDSNTTFNQALDLLPKRDKRNNLKNSSIYANECRVKTLRPAFGARKLSEFRTHRMKFVNDWFYNFSEETDASQQNMDHLASRIKVALEEAVSEGLLASPNPADEFPIKIPQKDRPEREVLNYDEITKLIKEAVRRDKLEHELTYRARRLSVFLGLLLGLRNSECGALCWDRVNFVDRRIAVNRCVRDGVIVDDTKTGVKGKRGKVPMNPILHAELLAHHDYMKSLGREVEGRVPILMTERADVITGSAIGDNWDQLAKKAGFTDQNGLNKHTFYVLRHTCFNLWKAVTIPIEYASPWGGHSNILTTQRKYYHETSDHFPGLLKEVKAWIRNLGMDGSPQDLLDCLGFALVRRWHDAGIDIHCAPPRSDTPDTPVPMLGSDAVKMLPGPNTIIDLVANTAASEVPSDDGDTLEALRARQRKAVHYWNAQNKTNKWIAKKVKICRSAVSDMLGSSPEAKWMRKTTLAERAALRERCHELRDEHPDWLAPQIAKELGDVPVHRVVKWEHDRGKPMPHRPGDHKLGRHHALIVQMIADQWTYRQMTDEINALPQMKENNRRISLSALGQYIKRHKLRENAKSEHRTSGVNIDLLYGDQILKLHSEHKNPTQISRALDKASISGIRGFLARKGLKPVDGRIQK